MTPRFDGKYFTHYSGNCKTTYDDLTLGRRTVITGPETSYKSAISIGIRLALTGQFPDVGSFPSDLQSLADEPTGGMLQRLSGPMGSFTWELPVGPEGKAKTPIGPDVDGELASLTEDERYCMIPSVAMTDLLKGAKGDRKLREAIIRRWGAGLDEVPCPYPQPADNDMDFFHAERAYWEETVERIREQQEAKGDTSIEGILSAMTETLRKESLAKSKEAKTLEKAISAQKLKNQSSTAGTEQLPGLLVQLEQAKRWELPETKQLVLDFINLAEWKSDLESDERALLDILAALKDIDAEITRHEDSFAIDQEERRADVDDKLASLKDLYRKLGNAEVNFEVFTKLASSADVYSKCPYCAALHPAETWGPRAEHFKARIAERSELISAAEAAYQTAKEDLESSENQFKLRLEDARRLRDSLRARAERGEAARATLKTAIADLNGKTPPKPYAGPSSHALQERIATLTLANKLKADVVKDEYALAKLLKEHEMLKKLEKDATVVQKTFMVSVARVASDEVSVGMPGGRQAYMDPETCDWYIIRPDGQKFGPFGVMSGTERMSLRLGLMRAWTRGSPIRIALLDDEDTVGLSDKGMRDMFEALDTAVENGDFNQVVFTTNRENCVPKDGRWTIIQCGLLSRHP